MAKVVRIDVTVTQTETEALLLEQNLIKSLRPAYNILLRDDKSYPYLYVSTDDEYPRIDFHRGVKRFKGRYFGPYPGVTSVRESLQFLQKTFQIRQCQDSFFNHRSRPCLQYQIHRCSAPCVRAIEPGAYAENVRHAIMFLEGREDTVLGELAKCMDEAASRQAYEQAARYRDQIVHLRHIRESQVVESGDGNVDVVALDAQSGVACVQVLTVRNGRVLGSRSYFPKVLQEHDPDEIGMAFLAQYYLAGADRSIPDEIIVDRKLPEDAVNFEKALQQTYARKIRITHAVKGSRSRWIELASRTARQNLLTRLGAEKNWRERFERLQEFLELDALPERLECYDVSHSAGDLPVASCVVFGPGGPVAGDFRRFNLRTEEGALTPGDDYGGLRQVLERRFTRLQRENAKLPDVVLIDGGKGQLSVVREVLGELQLTDICTLAIAKGSTRKAGFETLVQYDDQRARWRERVLPAHDATLHLLQEIRDEAHRYAITGHRKRRNKQQFGSVLESIPGIGAQRRKALLHHFGGQQEIARAGLDDLLQVPGIHKGLAEAIYQTFHSD